MPSSSRRAPPSSSSGSLPTAGSGVRGGGSGDVRVDDVPDTLTGDAPLAKGPYADRRGRGARPHRRHRTGEGDARADGGSLKARAVVGPVRGRHASLPRHPRSELASGPGAGGASSSGTQSLVMNSQNARPA